MGILGSLEATADRVMASDAAAIQLGRDNELLKCFQLPLLAGAAGVKIPSSNEQILLKAVTYPFQRPQGSVRTWHVWVDRFSMVFSRLLAKLVYQVKILSASLDFGFLRGSGSILFWGDESLLSSTEGSEWHWPNHLDKAHPSAEHLMEISDLSALSFVISNKTPLEMLESLWSAAVQMLEASEGLQLLFLEDSIREPWETIYRPAHSVQLAARCRSQNLQASRNVSVRMVWRRHHSTLSNADVVALNLGQSIGNRDVKVLMLDAREPRSSLQNDLDDLLRGKFSAETDAVRTEFGIRYSSHVSGLTGDFVRQVQDTAGQSFQETLETLAPYLDFHRRAVSAWGKTSDVSAKSQFEKNQFRALIYVCNPLTLCGGHGDRTNGILSAFLIALLTSRAFFIDFDSPLPLSLVLQPRLRTPSESESGYVLDWRIKGGSMGHGSQSFYLDDRVSFQEDLTWLVEDSSQILQLSMNHRELQAILVPLKKPSDFF